MPEYDCCEHCEHTPRHLTAPSDWQLWHAIPCEVTVCDTGKPLRGGDE